MRTPADRRNLNIGGELARFILPIVGPRDDLAAPTGATTARSASIAAEYGQEARHRMFTCRAGFATRRPTANRCPASRIGVDRWGFEP